LEGRHLFAPTTATCVQDTSHVVDDEEQNIVLDYSSITNAQPAEEVISLTEV
jgi:hypothetical protein